MEWLVEDEELFQIQNAKVGSYFICPQSWDSTQICIELIIYPNGFCQNEAGNVNIYIFTETPFNHSDELQIQYSLRCSVSDTQWSGIATFTSSNNNHRLSNKIRTESIMKCSRIKFSCSLKHQSTTNQIINNKYLLYQSKWDSPYSTTTTSTSINSRFCNICSPKYEWH